jgi:hypothetical protein
MESPAPKETTSPEPASARNPFFAMVLFSASIFILTILAMVAVIFSDPRAPVARFFEAHAGRLIVAEVAVTLALGFLALAVDRLQSRRGISSTQEPNKSAMKNASENPPKS